MGLTAAYCFEATRIRYFGAKGLAVMPGSCNRPEELAAIPWCLTPPNQRIMAENRQTTDWQFEPDKAGLNGPDRPKLPAIGRLNGNPAGRFWGKHDAIDPIRRLDREHQVASDGC